jgi:Predicted transcriptional regulators
MESSEFLDILGNENRRKILSLLADRPYFVSEISTRLSVAPKAVIGHLTLLENAGLIESSVDDQRRKYYSISKTLHLEVSVSPYSYSVHVNSIKLEIPDEPTYSLSVSFGNSDRKSGKRKKRGKNRTLPTGPVIHLPSSYSDLSGSDLVIQLVGPNPFFGRLGLLHGAHPNQYLSAGEDETLFDANSEKFYEDELNTVYDSEISSANPEIIFPEKDDKSSKSKITNSAGVDSENRLQSRDGYFLSQIFRVREDLADLWDEQEELSRLQEELTVRQNRLMRAFVHYAAQLSNDKIESDILFRLLREDMNTAELCHAVGQAPALILPRLKSFEEKNMVEKYLQGGDFVWRLKDGSDI